MIKYHFKITGEGLTRIVRDLWSEEEYKKAITILMEGLKGGITEDLAVLVCTGKKKLVGDESGMEVEDDNIGEQNGIKISILETITRLKNKHKKQEDEIKDWRNETHRIPSPWGLIEIPHSIYLKVGKKNWINKVIKDSEITWDDPFFDQYKKLEGDYKQGNVFAMESTSLTNENNEIFIRKDDEIDDVALPAAIEENQPPKIDNTLSALNGYIAPNGDFYPCQKYAQHKYVAQDLEKTEIQLDNEGWVKISDSQDNFSVDKKRPDFICMKKLTQSQINTLYDWYKKHNRIFPKDYFNDIMNGE
jgi:hypothetical protein